MRYDSFPLVLWLPKRTVLSHEPMSLHVLMCGRGLSTSGRGITYNDDLAHYSYNKLFADLNRL